jgi:hypothetical protein
MYKGAKILVVDLEETKTKNDCADQQSAGVPLVEAGYNTFTVGLRIIGGD